MPSQAYSPSNLPPGVIRRSHREVRFGAYILGSTLGEGEFGKVKLGWRKDGKQPSQVAIKLIKRESIPRGSERESKVHREINALKKLSHPNIVRLEEVLQNDKYVGIVLDYASGGELFDYIFHHKHLKDSMASKLFSQLVSGVDYMHAKHIVHRDLKLENLLLDKHKNIIITDFGFVNSFSPGNELMKTSCGSPCYAAPELVLKNEPYEARKVDVWSCGVILYAMLAGYLPFDDDPDNPEGTNISKLYNYISTTELTFPEYVQPLPRNLLRNILVPEPKYRYSLNQVRTHSWLAPHAPFLSVTPEEWDRNAEISRQHQAVAHQQKQQHQHQQQQARSNSFARPASRANSAVRPRHSANTRSTNRYSMVEPTTSSFAISTNPAAPPALPTPSTRAPPRSYSSHQVSNPLSYSHTSTTLASMPPSKSSASIKSLGETAVANESAQNVYIAPKTAQVVLQDVVNADNGKRISIYSDINDLAVEKYKAAPSSNDIEPSRKGVTARPTKNVQKLPGPDPHYKPRPSSYHPGLLPDGPLNADFSFLIPKIPSSVSPIKSVNESDEIPKKESPSEIPQVQPNNTPAFASPTVFDNIFGKSKDASPIEVSKELKVSKDSKELKVSKDSKELDELKDSKELNELKDSKDSNLKDSNLKDSKDSKDSKVSNDSNDYDLITNGAPPSPLQDAIDKKSKRNSKYGSLALLNEPSSKPTIPRSQSARIRSDNSTFTNGSRSEKKRFSIFGSFSGGNSYDATLGDDKSSESINYHKQSKSVSFGRRSSAVIGYRNRSNSVVFPTPEKQLPLNNIDPNKSSPTKQRVKSVMVTSNRKNSESISTTRKVLDFFRRRNVVKAGN